MSILVFLLAALFDYLSVSYFLAVQKKAVAEAVVRGVMLSLTVNVATILVVKDNWMLLPEAAGTAVGIWYAVTKEKASEARRPGRLG